METLEEQKISVVAKGNDSSKIHLFEWIWTSPHYNFVIAQDKGIHIVKITKEDFKLTELAFIPAIISTCWFEPISEILAVTSYHGILQLLYVSRLHTKQTAHLIKGPILTLDISQNAEGANSLEKKSNNSQFIC